MITSVKQERAEEPEVVAAALEYAAIVSKKAAASSSERSRLTVILVTLNVSESDLLEIAMVHTPHAA